MVQHESHPTRLAELGHLRLRRTRLPLLTYAVAKADAGVCTLITFLGKTQLCRFPQNRIKVVHDVVALLGRVRTGHAADSLETATLDFKTEKATFKETVGDLAEACVCFANAAGVPGRSYRSVT